MNETSKRSMIVDVLIGAGAPLQIDGEPIESTITVDATEAAEMDHSNMDMGS